ncbi:MAG: hypothetical protein KDA91_06310 [Planctomycetaceae bacterium]|nr:hypothetical protein [Planctomycetaceae bacterium]
MAGGKSSKAFAVTRFIGTSPLQHVVGDQNTVTSERRRKGGSREFALSVAFQSGKRTSVDAAVGPEQRQLLIRIAGQNQLILLA